MVETLDLLIKFDEDYNFPLLLLMLQPGLRLVQNLNDLTTYNSHRK